MGLSLGTALSGRIQFLWFIDAILVYIAITEKTRRDFFVLKNIFVFAIGMIIGALSFILGNITGHFLSFIFFSKYAVISRSGIHNFNYFANFTERFKQTISLIDSTALRSSFEYPNYLGGYLFFMGVVFIAISTVYKITKKQKLMDDNRLLPILLFIFIIMQSPFTITYFDVHHMIVLLPFMCLVMVLPMHIMFKSYASRLSRLLGVAALLSLILFTGHNCRLLIDYKAYRNIHCGTELKWNVMSDALRFMEAKGIKNIGLGDTGLMDTMLFLSNFSFGVDEVFYAPYKSLSRQEQEELLVERLNSINFVPADADYFNLQYAERKKNEYWCYNKLTTATVINDRASKGLLTMVFERKFFDVMEHRYGIKQLPEIDLFTPEKEEALRSAIASNLKGMKDLFWQFEIDDHQIHIPTNIEIDPYEVNSIILNASQVQNFAITNAEFGVMFDRFCYDNITRLNRSKSWKKLRETLIHFAEYYLNIFEFEARKLFLFPYNKALLIEHIAVALEHFEAWQNEQGNANRRVENSEWEVPGIRYYNDSFNREEITSHALEPFFEELPLFVGDEPLLYIRFQFFKRFDRHILSCGDHH